MVEISGLIGCFVLLGEYSANIGETVNRKNMRRVADFIESENAQSFDMSRWHHFGDGVVDLSQEFNSSPAACGSAMCIGGTANYLKARDLFEKKRKIDDEITVIDEAGAADFLGLTDRQKNHLFYCITADIDSAYYISYDYINRRKHLVPDALRWMAKTGEVNWRKALEYAQCVYDEKRSKGEPSNED